MHIVIDGRMVSNTGIGRWLQNIVSHLIRLGSPHRFTVLVNRDSEHVRRFAGCTRRLAFSAPIYSLREQVLLPLEAARCRPDLVHYPNFNFPLAATTPCVVTLCDLIYYLFPQACPSWLAHQYARRMIQWSANRARKLVTISEYSKQDLIRWLGVREEKVVVAYPAVDLDLYRPDHDPEAIEAVRQKLGIDRPYLFYTGNHEPRKNVHRLVQAFREMKGRDDFQLVVGGLIDPRRKPLYDGAAELVERRQVIFSGQIPEAELPLVYAGASLFVFPSSYEGFGLPPLEAMASGVPVITSSASSLPEVVGEAAIQVSAESVEEIRWAMERVLGDRDLWRELRQKGLARARTFSWEAGARQVLAAYEAAV
jgi:glycosyltransferase involved in cell wall biosynthesis